MNSNSYILMLFVLMYMNLLMLILFYFYLFFISYPEAMLILQVYFLFLPPTSKFLEIEN